MDKNKPGELFAETYNETPQSVYPEWADTGVIAGLHSDNGINLAALPARARRLFELSINAFSAIVHARMSELPVTPAITRFEQKILAAADTVTRAAGSTGRGETEAARRQAAEQAAGDRGDPDVQAVMEAAYKVRHEIHRLMGLLRFSPNDGGEYIALCEPDHFVLPALGPHFRERFGKTSWSIIDKKRCLCLRGDTGGYPVLFTIDTSTAAEHAPSGSWENLWRYYHKTINNADRNNPGLQRRFMPRRYWKYLTER